MGGWIHCWALFIASNEMGQQHHGQKMLTYIEYVLLFILLFIKENIIVVYGKDVSSFEQSLGFSTLKLYYNCLKSKSL